MKPKLLLAKSYVFTCYSCGAWQYRSPQIFGDGSDGKGDQCHKCGCTSFNIREGRPYGTKSKEWEWITKEFDSCWRFINIEFEGHTIVCKPSLQEMKVLAKCPDCDGTGARNRWNCDRCSGTGMVDE